MGVVTEVYDGSSSVRLLSDTRSLVIGIDVATRATGEVKGNLSAPLLLDKVAATETLKLGRHGHHGRQLVRGIKALLPRDLLIGSDRPGQRGDPASSSSPRLSSPPRTWTGWRRSWSSPATTRRACQDPDADADAGPRGRPPSLTGRRVLGRPRPDEAKTP